MAHLPSPVWINLVIFMLIDHCNIRKFLATGLLVTAAVNLSLGYIHSFIFFAVLWGVSGWFQSIGAPSCVVELSRWYNEKERGTFYGIWIISHNLGEGLTWILSTFIVAALGWRFGFFCSGLLGMLGVLVIWKFVHDTPESEGLIFSYANLSDFSGKSRPFSIPDIGAKPRFRDLYPRDAR